MKINEALNRNSDLMREIAIAAKVENELMAVMVGKSQKDSHTIKLLTIIALIYLPASLVAVSLYLRSKVFFAFIHGVDKFSLGGI